MNARCSTRAVGILLSQMFVLKDGDMSTSWSCTGDPTPDDDVYECYVTFSMFAYRHIKQVKIGEPAPRAVHASQHDGFGILLSSCTAIDPSTYVLYSQLHPVTANVGSAGSNTL